MSGTPDPLEQILADAREEAALLRRAGHPGQAVYVEAFCDRIASATEDYRRFVSEKDAQLRSSRSVAWLRGEFPGWERAGHAYRDKQGRRWYRLLVLPARADIVGAQEDAKRMAQG